MHRNREVVREHCHVCGLSEQFEASRANVRQVDYSLCYEADVKVFRLRNTRLFSGTTILPFNSEAISSCYDLSLAPPKRTNPEQHLLCLLYDPCDRCFISPPTNFIPVIQASTSAAEINRHCLRSGAVDERLRLSWCSYNKALLTPKLWTSQTGIGINCIPSYMEVYLSSLYNFVACCDNTQFLTKIQQGRCWWD